MARRPSGSCAKRASADDRADERLRLPSDAFADLDEIWEYIAENNVDAADRVLAHIHSTLTTLAGSPQIGHRRPDLNGVLRGAGSVSCVFSFVAQCSHWVYSGRGTCWYSTSRVGSQD